MMQFELVQTVISQVCRSFFERDNLLKLMDIRERGPPALGRKISVHDALHVSSYP